MSMGRGVLCILGKIWRRLFTEQIGAFYENDAICCMFAFYYFYFR